MGPLIFPGEGNLTQVLSKIRRIGADMHEFEHTCQCLHARLKRISQALDVNDQNLPGDSRNRYVAVVTKYLHYLKHHRGKKMVYRVVEHRIMTDELSRISEEVAKIFALLGLSTSTASWSDFWRDEILALEDVLDTTVGDKKIVTREFQDRRDREEAMLTLKFEIDRRKERHDDFILTLMGKLMATIMSVFDSRVEGLPPWFIPSNEVSYQSRAFARGSCSTVHHGEWGLGTNVVVKCFLVDNVAMDESVQLKIIYEINIWHRLNHPNVIKVYGASTVSSPPFIVCEDAINGHLGSFLAQSGENKRRMWPLLHQAALGLDYIHKQGVVHGDLKLSNILVGADGQAKVSAFRSSAIRTCSPRAKTNSSGIASGGLRWRAPESLRKGPNFALDVYSLALCIIEAVIGEPLLAFRRDDSIRENLQQGELPERPDEMSDEVWELVISMTSKDPDNRLSLHHVIERMKSYAERAMTVCGDTECAVGTTGDAVVRAESQTRRSMIDSSIPDLIAGVQADNAEEQDETLLRLVQACVNDDQRHHNINANTVSVLADIVKNSPTFFGRVCALECLHWSADTDSTFPLDEFETLRDCVRDVMPDECTTLVNTLRINNEQQKLRAVVYLQSSLTKLRAEEA
ncbi:hypothetical protein PHYBOEH_001828 [Phytophthora boehmeriae]|uniref:Protein kinase domain-containing protein n=1 Tax=Phytophthora boehmeriae TaxID=109152 RepID=A0A8T1WRR5_9STRA|nr:hypothetical protein PHYBOEH_001828 [Phytophthora boehmeriae]